MPQVREHRGVAEEDAESKPLEESPQKVRVAGHLKVGSWGSTACCSSPPRSRTSSPAPVSEKVSPSREEKEERREEQEEAGEEEEGGRFPAGLRAPRSSLPWKVASSSTSARTASASLPASGPDAMPQLSSLRLPPGLFLPLGLSFGGAPPAVTDTLCGKCDERAEHNLGSEACSSEEGIADLSAGSIGHPHSCAGACRYVKRKGGCRDGSKCQHCHLCFWSRTAETDAGNNAAQNEAVVVSIGTRGHPHNCGAACKYARRKGGCRDGANCLNCHACLWQRDRPETAGSPQEAVGPTKQTSQSLPEAEQSFFGDSTQKLAELIADLLSRQEA